MQLLVLWVHRSVPVPFCMQSHSWCNWTWCHTSHDGLPLSHADSGSVQPKSESVVSYKPVLCSDKKEDALEHNSDAEYSYFPRCCNAVFIASIPFLNKHCRYGRYRKVVISSRTEILMRQKAHM